ncbi:MAG: chemotaxis protein CheA [Bdellovibrionota bacterium]
MAADEGRQIAEFVSEAEELIDSLHRDLFSLEEMAEGKPFNPDLVNAIFRGAHSLKGLAGMFGFSELQGLAHDLENLLDALRLGKVTLARDLVDLLFRGVEALGRLVAARGKGEGLPGVESLRQEILAAAQAKPESSAKAFVAKSGIDPKILEVLTEYEEHRLSENLKLGRWIHKVTGRFLLDTFDTDLAAVSDKLKQKGEVLSTLPSGEASGENQIVFDLIVASDEPAAPLEAHLQGSPVTLATLVAARAGGAPPPASGPVAAPSAEAAPPAAEGVEEGLGSVRSVSQTVRVDIRRLDVLMNVVGELVAQRNTFSRLADHLRDIGQAKLAQQLGREVRTFERKIAELQSGVMATRMVPVSQVFDRLARVVRKSAKSLGKEVDLQMFGGETELDKLLVEELADPLMHIIRNSLDHGLEPPAERLLVGKPGTGKVTLRAYPQGNHVVIEVTDDGKGIDLAKVRKRAVERGLLAADAEPTEAELLEFIYLPGFSTKDGASELSGRGVGMDVVKNNIAALSGVLETRTEAGKGTTIRITLPITLAIIGALVIECRGRTYAVPVNSVLQCLRVTETELSSIEGRHVLQVEGRTVPVVALADFFRLGGEAPGNLPYRYVIVVGLAEKRLGLLVDRLVGQQDIVIKPVGDLLSETPGVAGATDLGGQHTVLVLDVGGVIRESFSGGAAGRRTAVKSA